MLCKFRVIPKADAAMACPLEDDCLRPGAILGMSQEAACDQHGWAGYFSRLPVGRIRVSHSPPGTEENHSKSRTEENTYLKQI